MLRGWQERLAEFGGERTGTVAIIFALAVFTIACLLGLTVDYGRAVNASEHVATALDAAVLAATEQMGDSDLDPITLQNNVAAYLNAEIGSPRMQGASYSGLAAAIDPNSGTIRLDVDVSVPTTLASLFNVRVLKFHKFNKTSYRVRNVELAMVLDTTGSMGQFNKINELKAAAAQAIDILLPPNRPAVNRIGLVPFSASVDASPFASSVTGGASLDCVVERSGADAYTDASGLTSFVGTAAVSPPGGGNCPAQSIYPLSKDPVALKAMVNTYVPGGSTAGHIGLAWGWYMLSPNWNNIWPKPSRVRAYGDPKAIKAVLLMTDGMFNTSYNGNPTSPVQAVAVCDAMKAAGVRIYTIGLELALNGSPDDVNARTLLSGCASPDGNGGTEFYDVANGANLAAAFTSIAGKLAQLRLAQ
jgi:Flp pilus assembly protein TadG